MKRKESKSRKIFNVFNYSFMALFSLATLYPFWYVLICSFNEGRDFTKGGVWLWPRVFTLENYELAFQDPRIFRSLCVSVFITVTSVLINLAAASLVSYAFTVKNFPGKKFFTFFWYFTTLFGGGMIPYYLLLRRLGLTRSIWLYIIPNIYSFSDMILMRANMQNIPNELRESAQLDGASDRQVLTRIYLPLSKAILATLALFIGVDQWNSWFAGAYYQTNTKLWPAATLLRELMSTAISAIEEGKTAHKLIEMEEMLTYTSQSLQMAFVMILTMPIIVVYPFLQKYFVKGMLVGSVKG